MLSLRAVYVFKKLLKTPAQLHKQHHVALAKSPVTISKKTQRDAGRILWWITKAQTRMTVQRELSCGSRLLPFISGCTMSLFVGGRTSLITYLQISPQQRQACRQCLVVELKQRIVKKKKKNCRTIWVEKATNIFSFFQHWQWSSQRTTPPCYQWSWCGSWQWRENKDPSLDNWLPSKMWSLCWIMSQQPWRQELKKGKAPSSIH